MANISFREIQWLPSIWVNFLRSFATSLVFGTLMAFSNIPDKSIIIVAPILLPIAYLIFYAPLALIGSYLARFFSLAGFLCLPAFLMTVPGDPLVYILWRIRPGMVPLQKCNFFNFHGILFVTHDPNAPIESEYDRFVSDPVPQAPSVFHSTPPEPNLPALPETPAVSPPSLPAIPTAPLSQPSLPKDISNTPSPVRSASRDHVLWMACGGGVLAVLLVSCLLEAEIFHGRPDKPTVQTYVEREIAEQFKYPEMVKFQTDVTSNKLVSYGKVNIQATVKATLNEPLYKEVPLMDAAQEAGHNPAEYTSFVGRALMLPTDLSPQAPSLDSVKLVSIASQPGTEFVYRVEGEGQKSGESWSFSPLRPQPGSNFPPPPQGFPASAQGQVLVLGTKEANQAITAFVASRRQFEEAVKLGETAYSERKEKERLAQEKAEADAKMEAAAKAESDRQAALATEAAQKAAEAQAAAEKAAEQKATRDKLIALIKRGARLEGNLIQVNAYASYTYPVVSQLTWDDGTQEVSGWLESTSRHEKKSVSGKIITNSDGKNVLELKETGMIEQSQNPGLLAGSSIVGIVYLLSPDPTVPDEQLTGTWSYQDLRGTIKLAPVAGNAQAVNTGDSPIPPSPPAPLADHPTAHSHVYDCFDLKKLPAGHPADSWVYGAFLGYDRKDNTLVCCAMKAGGFIRGYSTEVDIQYSDGLPEALRSVAFPFNPIDNGVGIAVKKEAPLHILSISYWDGVNAAGYRGHNVRVVVEDSSGTGKQAEATNSSSAPTANNTPLGIPLPDQPGFVLSPYAREREPVDVRGYPSGTTVRCPYTNKEFVIP